MLPLLKPAKLINKSTYLEYLDCSKNTWLKFNKSEQLRDYFESSDKSLAQQNLAIEQEAYKLFPDGVTIASADKNTATLVTQEQLALKPPALLRPTFIYKEFLVVADVLVYDGQKNCWNLYEISSKSGLDEDKKKNEKERIIRGLTFQTIVLKALGIELGEIFIVYLDKTYVLVDAVNTEQLFVTTNVTQAINIQEDSVKQQMFEMSKVLLEDEEERVTCKCIYEGRSKHCETFAYSHSNVPAYSVHDLASIGRNKEGLEELVNAGVFKVNEVPDNIDLTNSQKNQIASYKQQKTLINYERIQEELRKLNYPLYFLDYETYAPAIPIFEGFNPYLAVTFQFSLHVLNSQDSEPIHYEYLHESNSDPSLSIAQKLQEFIGPTGNVIVWYKIFECGRNSELAQRHPIFKEFFDDLNIRIYDLMEIFKKQYYVHPNFFGSSSIKKVLPALVPELSYKELAIQKGDVASQKWFDMVYGNLEETERRKISHDLRTYCCLDTYAMYAIWKHLMTNCNASKIAVNKTHSETIVIK